MIFEKILSLDDIVKIIREHRIILGVIAGLALGSAGVFFYLQFSRIARNESAQMALAETFDEMNSAYHNPELWQEVEVAARTGLRQFKGADISPYFISVHVETLIQQNKLQEALELMQEMLTKITPQNPFYFVFKIKYARMKMDSTDKEVSNSGLQDLIALSEDPANKNYDEALYYLGNYYLNTGAPDQAVKAWKALVEREKNVREGIVSPWVTLAQHSLQETV